MCNRIKSQEGTYGTFPLGTAIVDDANLKSKKKHSLDVYAEAAWKTHENAT